ncbi:4-(cytidine 5'-diphospho)-2-C-methyl-D-erythritol kinase [Sphingobacterium sp. HJSM2_6]|uniref:4-(cytidine 5'-diphospho)-2-C-methyl-D-erythritol kinase n=1 Tax=Sphingobacterium sp. HJSM2_6 TaxID=3366264 RepID=UPI003BC8B1BC
MLTFANAKINIGLQITSKRADGYHNLETIFYPVQISDAIEVLPSDKLAFNIWNTDLEPSMTNLCVQAYQLIKADYDIPAVTIHLLKNIPIGAGLGGGSSDASATLNLLNNFFELNIPQEQMLRYASRLGADCPFFIDNKPCYAHGTGTDLSPIALSLNRYQMVIVKPPVHISTAEAYSQVMPTASDIDLRLAIKLPIQEWKLNIRNDFEFSLFEKYPLIADIKNKLYELGAHYASMSGSGSAVYGIFDETKGLEELNKYGKVFIA